MGERKTVIKILYFLLKKFEHCPGAIVSIVMYFVLVTLIRFRRPLTFARTMQTRKGYNLSILLVSIKLLHSVSLAAFTDNSMQIKIKSSKFSFLCEPALH